MADLSDVSAALRAMIVNALYPPALYPGGQTGVSIAGMIVEVQSGWPDPDSLKTQIAAKNGQVTVYPQQAERNTTRYPQTWAQSAPVQPHTITLTAAGYTVTVGGAQPAPFYSQNLAVFVNGKPYLYSTLSGDTLSTIATALAALIAADIPGTSAAGAIITVPAPARIGVVRVGTTAQVSQELKRQERDFSLIVWAASTAARDRIASYIDVVIPQNKFLSLEDGSQARLIYKGSPYSDFDQKQGIFRRDFSVSVEYATIATANAPQAIAIKTVYSQEAPDGSTITPPIETTYT